MAVQENGKEISDLREVNESIDKKKASGRMDRSCLFCCTTHRARCPGAGSARQDRDEPPPQALGCDGCGVWSAPSTFELH